MSTPIDAWDPETQDIYEILEEVIDTFDDLTFEPENMGWTADWDDTGEWNDE